MLPVWRDYMDQLHRFDDSGFPSPTMISEQIAMGLLTGSGKPVSFISSDELGSVANYEQHISRSGEISTRPGNFHDLFNALVWSRYPGIKAAMNAAHCREITANPGGQRSKCRDALTLFDECGVVIVSSNSKRLGQLAQHDWRCVYQDNAAEWGEEHFVFVVGHALLEKYLQPYKAITAQALLCHHADVSGVTDREVIISFLDEGLAAAINAGTLLKTTRNLSAVPLAGIPGWWPEDQVGRDFYTDPEVFRPLGSRRPAAPVYGQDIAYGPGGLIK